MGVSKTRQQPTAARHFDLMSFRQNVGPGSSCGFRFRSLVMICLLSLNQTSCKFSTFFGSFRDADEITLTSISAPLPDDAFKAIITLTYPPPATLHTGQVVPIHCVVKNASNILWPSMGLSNGYFQITFGNHWLDLNHKMIVVDDGRSVLPYDLQPGGEAEFLITIRAPATPGEYILELDLVQEQVAWFVHKGSQNVELRITVSDAHNELGQNR